MTHDSVGLEVLSEGECYALASTARIGRVVFSHQALPAVWPVTFAMDGESVILCAPAGSNLARTMNRTVVAFEVDAFSADTRTGWSVTFLGLADAITEPAQVEYASAIGLMPLGHTGDPVFIRLACAQATGRRICSYPMQAPAGGTTTGGAAATGATATGATSATVPASRTAGSL